MHSNNEFAAPMLLLMDSSEVLPQHRSQVDEDSTVESGMPHGQYLHYGG